MTKRSLGLSKWRHVWPGFFQMSRDPFNLKLEQFPNRDFQHFSSYWRTCVLDLRNVALDSGEVISNMKLNAKGLN